jgi:hypothetical protein|tara:strand:- start:484 stop:630 length:147 start_codon:yes stop_codon:yes gene_type:complete
MGGRGHGDLPQYFKALYNKPIFERGFFKGYRNCLDFKGYQLLYILGRL